MDKQKVQAELKLWFPELNDSQQELLVKRMQKAYSNGYASGWQKGRDDKPPVAGMCSVCKGIMHFVEDIELANQGQE